MRAAAVFSAAALALTACSSSGSSSTSTTSTTTHYHLTGTAGLASDAFWISLQCGGTQQAAAEGATIKWYASTSGTDNNIIAQTVDAAQLSWGTPTG